MAKRTRKVGITGKYGTRYGASLRKVVKKEPGQIFSFHSRGPFVLKVRGSNPLLEFHKDLSGIRGLVLD